VKQPFVFQRKSGNFLLKNSRRWVDMANLQIRLDDSLKDQAQAVVQDMGLDLSAAVRIFLAQVVKENGLPFRPTNEPFYSVKNQEALRRSAAQIEAGQMVIKSLDELRSME
jgi:DNA-damage-inducible protein J